MMIRKRVTDKRLADLEIETSKICVSLKSGEYNGSDIMRAWLLLSELQQALKAERETVTELEQEVKRWEETAEESETQFRMLYREVHGKE